jgi:hypothetical protein
MTQTKEDILEKRIVKYDEWLHNGKISYSSRVIPIPESFNAKLETQTQSSCHLDDNHVARNALFY